MGWRRRGRDENKCRPDRLRHALHANEHRKQGDEGLEQINKRQAACLARMFEDLPRARGVGNRQQSQYDSKGDEEDQGAAEINERPRPRLRRRIENVGAHMTADLQHPGGGKQKHRRLSIENGFLNTDRTDAEYITHHHGRELGDNDKERAPHRRAADGRVYAVDAVSDAVERNRHGLLAGCSM